MTSATDSRHLILTPDTTATGPGHPALPDGRGPEELRAVAVAVASEAARHVRASRRAVVGEDGHVPVAATKSSEVDPVTAVDRSSEALIRSLLGDLAADDGVLGEEDGGTLRRDGVTWIVDPVDGTVNFIYGVPASAVSVAATVDGRPVAGAVADIARRRVFSACVGGPARSGDETPDGWAPGPGETLPEKALGRVLSAGPGPEDLGSALVATGFSYGADRRATQARLLTGLLPRIRDIRRFGSAALDLCAVASGTVDGYYEHGLGPWDYAAGVLIAARAGAEVHMPVLGLDKEDGVGVAAASPRIAGELAAHTLAEPMPERR